MAKGNADHEKVPKAVGYHKLYRYATPTDGLLIALGTLGGIAHGATLPLWALLFGDVINTFGAVGSDFMEKVRSISLAFMYLAVGSFVVSYLQMGLWMLVGSRQARAMRIRFLLSALNQDISFYDTDASTGALLNRMEEDCVTIETAMGEKAGTFVFNVSMFFSGIGIALAYGWDLTLVVLAAMPLVGGSMALLFKVMGDSSRKSQAAYSEANSIAQSALSAVRTVYSFNAEAATQAAYERRLGVPERMGVRQSAAVGLCLGAFQLFMFCAYALALWYAAGRIRSGEYDGGTVMTVFFSALIGGFSIGQANPCIVAFQNGRIAGARLFAVIDRAPSIDPHSGGRKLDNALGEISLLDVEFSYPTRPDIKVFDGITLTAEAGKTVALVGQSGSGKSTIIALVERYYDPSRGTICLDGVSLRELDLMWLRSKVALVSQEPTLFATSIYDNISFGSPEATEEQVHAAARMANADTFIRALPAGYSTSVGEGGVQLSGGQKQRIAIARAILKAPKVLLLDEATSALDSQSERLVQEALETVMAERTTIVVAHRLSTIRRANRICVLHQGRLVEQGSHAELIQNLDGAYSQLVALQHSPDTGGSRAALDSGNGLAPKAKSSSEASDSTGATVDSGIELAEKIPAKERRLFGFLGKRRKNAVAPDEEMGTSPGTVEDAQTSKSNMSRLIALNAKEWPLMILGSIGSAGLGSTMPALAYVLSSIITVFYSDGDDQEQKANMWCMIFALIGLASFIFGFLEQYSFGVMGARLATRIRCMLFAAILKQEVGWFDREENNSGAMTSMLGTDAAHIRGAVGDTFGIMFQNLFTFAAGFAIAFINNWKMTLVIIAAVPLLIFSGIIQAKVAQGMSDESTSKDAANADQVAMESFRNIRIVQAFNLQDSITDLWERHSTADAMAKSKRAHVTGIGFGVSQFSMFAVYSLAFWYGGQQVKDGEMSFDEMLKVFFAVLLGATGASNAQMSFPDAHKASDAAKRIFRVIDRVPRIDANDNAPPPKGGMVGSIVLDSVTFKYPNRPDVTVLQKLDLSINSGQMVALVGESGSGKSTIIGLVERFYDTAAGAVRIDGVDIKQLPIRWVRDNVGLVSQEPTLFAMTVKENIKLGRPNATDEEVREAAEHANAAAFIEALPEGYDTLVGDRGASLSGGQKQRVAIARAVLKDPRVLLLDEATSALDAENERLVADALEKLMAGRTTIVVAHRLSTIRNANVIAVMEHGKIVEQGTHDELLANNQNGPYARLIRLQQH